MEPHAYPCCQNREAQVYNLGSKGKRNRFVLGLFALVTSLAGAVAMVLMGYHWIWRFSLFLPLFFGIVLVLQARTRTCVVLAAIGAWDLDCGTQRVPDPDLERRLRHRAYGLVGMAAAGAFALTALISVL